MNERESHHLADGAARRHQRDTPGKSRLAISNWSPPDMKNLREVIRVNDEGDELWIPNDDTDDPEISIVIPALNERITIGDFVNWCKEGLSKANVKGEVLIIDSSSDETPYIALERGARVLKTSKRGLGRAYIDSLPHIRGKYVLLGDCDCTYDFRNISLFVESFRQGYEYIMGTRFKGKIEDGAMPALHRYFGTPLTTWILNFIYKSKFSDIHCGMRGITKDALIRMDLHSQSWEYASEMIIKSIHMGLKTTEIPITFWKDREGRRSHLTRNWYTPWYSGWINLRAIFIYKADFFLFVPGIFLAILGLLLVLPMSLGPLSLGPVKLSIYGMLFGLVIAILGIQSFLMGIVAKAIYDYTGEKTKRWLKVFGYTRTTLLSSVMFVLGVLMTTFLISDYIKYGLTLPYGMKRQYYLAVTGLLFIITAFMLFTFTLLLHTVSIYVKRKRS